MHDIRPLRIKDAKDLECLHKECFDRPWQAETFESLLMHGAFGWRHAYGFIMLRMHDVLTFCVHPLHRRQSIGKTLAKSMLIHAQSPLFLEVSVSNLPAIHLYQSYGFSFLRYRRHYYGVDQDALSLAYLPSSG